MLRSRPRHSRLYQKFLYFMYNRLHHLKQLVPVLGIVQEIRGGDAIEGTDLT